MVVHCSDGEIDYSDILFDDDSSVIADGTCGAEADGSNLKWSLTENGTLTISGTGSMRDYNYYINDSENIAPWKDFSDKIISVVFESGVTHIGNYLFNNYSYKNLSHVFISDSVTSIGAFVFDDCDSLTHVEIPSSVLSIGDGAFTECDGLSSVIISDGVKTIGNYAFQVCGVKQIRIPASVTSLGEGPFMACSQLEGIQVDPANPNYTSVDGVLFNKELSLLIQYPAGKENSSYDIPAGVTEIGYNAFESCYRLKNVSFPSGLRKIGAGAFYLCRNLGDIVLPQGLISIGRAAFRVCESMVNVTIPDSVMMIDSGAFTFCRDFKNVYYMGTEEQWKTISIDRYNPFDNLEEDGTTYAITIYYNSSGPSIDDILDPLPMNMIGYKDQVWRLNRDFATFGKLFIDNVELRPNVDYTAESGSVKLNIPARTFARFGAGTHTIRADFNGGSPISQNYTVTTSDDYRIESNLGNGVMEYGVKNVPYSGYLTALDRSGNPVEGATLEIVSPTEEFGLRLYTEDELSGPQRYFAGAPLKTGSFSFTVAMILDGVYVTSRQFVINIRDNTETEVEHINEGNPEYAFDEIPDIPLDELDQEHEFYTAGSPEELWKVYLDGRELKYPDEYTFGAADADLESLFEIFAKLMESGGTRIVIAAQTTANLDPGMHIISADFLKQLDDGTKEKETSAKSFYVGARPTPTPRPASGGGGGGSRSRTTIYQVSVTNPRNGSLKVSRDSAASGTTVTITATPNTGYRLTSVRVAGIRNNVTVNGSGNTRTFTMPSENVTVSAEFERISYRINTTNALNGSFTVSHTQASGGAVITITTKPDKNYAVESIRVTGGGKNGDIVVSGSDNRYKFTMPNGQVTVTVKFRQFKIANFIDVDGNHTFFGDILWTYNNGLMNGITEQYFEPDGFISYITVVVTIARLAKVDLSGYEGMTGEAVGVPDDAWYLKEALWARDIGLFASNGNLDGLFLSGVRVDRSPISRGTFAIMLRNYLNFHEIDTEVPVENRVGFADANRMSSLEEDHAFQTLYRAKIFRGGEGADQFKMYPTANTKRGNLAALLHRMSEYIESYRSGQAINETES